MKVKMKGEFALSGPGLPGAAGQKKNPNMDICNTAVVEFLKTGIAVEDTIEFCPDVRQFLTVRRVTGGALDQDGNKIGKALRWYYSKAVSGGFRYAKNGNAVPESIGAKLMMELGGFPTDLDYDYYVRESYGILQDLGVQSIDPALRGRNGRTYARLPDAKGIHIIDLATGVAICGKKRESIRDTWVEYRKMPDGMRMCGKCKKAE